MPYALDPEIAAVAKAMADQGISFPVTARGDWKAKRDGMTPLMEQMMSQLPLPPEVAIKVFTTKSKDGAEIELRWTARKNGAAGPAVLYIHGGGMIMGTAKMYDPLVANYVNVTGVPFLSVEYRLAPEAQGEMLVEDCFAGLTWLIANASKFGIDPKRIAIMGDSAGGGLAAGLAIMARDRGVPLALQILIYPMLDDRNQTPDPAIGSFGTWSYDDNFTGWSALIGKDFGTDRVSPIVAPARLKDFKGLAPAYIDVGELDIFRNENIAYAQQLALASIPVEFHLHPGAPHGGERVAPDSALAKRLMADRFRVIQSL
jgi:acetyl esterase/lipase